MKRIIIILCVLFITGCSKPKTAFICGDHVCVNKKEAEQYFEKNLTIEVQILDKKKKDEIDLVELNLKNNSNNIKQVSITKKNDTKEGLKVLSNSEIKKIKKNLKKNNKKKKVVKKDMPNDILEKKKKKEILNEKDVKIANIRKNSEKKIFKKNRDIADVCIIIEKCNIEEISKYLLKEGNKKKFPDITKR